MFLCAFEFELFALSHDYSFVQFFIVSRLSATSSAADARKLHFAGRDIVQTHKVAQRLSFQLFLCNHKTRQNYIWICFPWFRFSTLKSAGRLMQKNSSLWFYFVFCFTSLVRQVSNTRNNFKISVIKNSNWWLQTTMSLQINFESRLFYVIIFYTAAVYRYMKNFSSAPNQFCEIL